MKNYLYFGIDNQYHYYLTQNMSGNLTIDTSAVGTGNLGGQALATLLTPAHVAVYITPKNATANYFGTDYNAGGKLGTRTPVAGKRYLLSEPETLTWANNSPDPVLVYQSGESGDTAHGITGKTGDLLEIVIKGGGTSKTYEQSQAAATGGKQHPQGAPPTGAGDGDDSTGPDRGDGLSGLATVYPEDSYLGGKETSAVTTEVYFKKTDGTYDRETVTFTHATGMGKQLLKEVTGFAKGSAHYHGMIRVYDGIEGLTQLSPELGITGITIV